PRQQPFQAAKTARVKVGASGGSRSKNSGTSVELLVMRLSFSFIGILCFVNQCGIQEQKVPFFSEASFIGIGGKGRSSRRSRHMTMPNSEPSKQPHAMRLIQYQ